jgi:hypothetical protein
MRRKLEAEFLDRAREGHFGRAAEASLPFKTLPEKFLTNLQVRDEDDGCSPNTLVAA